MSVTLVIEFHTPIMAFLTGLAIVVQNYTQSSTDHHIQLISSDGGEKDEVAAVAVFAANDKCDEAHYEDVCNKLCDVDAITLTEAVVPVNDSLLNHANTFSCLTARKRNRNGMKRVAMR